MSLAISFANTVRSISKTPTTPMEIKNLAKNKVVFDIKDFNKKAIDDIKMIVINEITAAKSELNDVLDITTSMVEARIIRKTTVLSFKMSNTLLALPYKFKKIKPTGYYISVNKRCYKIH